MVVVPDAGVLFAGDLVENGHPPDFGDGFPLDWPAPSGPSGRSCAARSSRATATSATSPSSTGRSPRSQAIADLARQVAAGALGFDEAVAAAPYPSRHAREAIERALAQARGELDLGWSA